MKPRYYIYSATPRAHFVKDRVTGMSLAVYPTRDQAVIRRDKLNEAWNAETRVQRV